jgi:hypothetical protein
MQFVILLAGMNNPSNLFIGYSTLDKFKLGHRLDRDKWAHSPF